MELSQGLQGYTLSLNSTRPLNSFSRGQKSSPSLGLWLLDPISDDKQTYQVPRIGRESHAVGVSLTHLSVILRSHACHLPYYVNLTHFSQKSSEWAWFSDLRMRSSLFNANVELARVCCSYLER